MSPPSVQVLGVHPLKVTRQLLKAQLAIFHPDGYTLKDKAATREQLKSVVLVEVRVVNRDERFSVDNFTQPIPDTPRPNWQAPWAEAFLTPDGESLAVERGAREPRAGDLRIAFFLHYWNENAPLRSSYGDVPCPRPTPMPKRLEKLVPYEPLD